MPKIKRILSFFLASVLAFSAFAFNAGAVGSFEEWVENWNQVNNGTGYIILTPGADETKMNFSWQSPIGSLEEYIYIGKTADLSDKAKLDVDTKLNIFGMEWTHESTAEKLEAETNYYYHYNVY